MIYRLWHKLVLTIIGITGIVLILSLYISDQSVKKGFLSYINQVESNRLNGLASNLIEGYQESNDWEFIRGNRRLWHRFNQRSKSPLPRGNNPLSDKRVDNSLQIINDLATKEKRDLRPPRPNDHLFDRPPPRKKAREGSRPPPRNEFRGERSPPRRNSQPPPKNLVLLDGNKNYVMGGGGAPLESSTAILKNISTEGKVVGFLQFEPFTQFTDELDKQFIQYQNNAFLKIALLALGIILIGTALLAAYLRSRINKIGDQAGLLTSGDFSPQSLDKSNDELGQLSHKLNLLGKTLEDNRLSRRRWVSDISHELRTPVAVLQGEIEAIQDGIREMNIESVNSLHNETLRLSRLVNDLHQLSLSDIGALNYIKAPVNIVELVKGILLKHEHQFKIKNIAVKFDAMDDELIVIADAQRLEQLFSNLATNSQHYTLESGQLVITIKQLHKNIIVEWSDSKPGVTDEELDNLFERLYRVEESRNRNAGGSGLGLSICKNIVEAHDASIIAEHSSLGGITFVMTFKNANT